MILIANPIYDVVFKYLLDDNNIARELLSTILGETITELNIKPQETIIKDDTSGEIKIFRLDFKAVIKLENGLSKTVLIELQKAKQSHDISRFRTYLGENYKKLETIILPDGRQDIISLEIVSIYILGFNLEGVNVPVLKVSRTYTDAITNEIVAANNDFITKLTHECYTIQIKRLKHEQRNKLEEVLEIFSQDNVTENTHSLKVSTESTNPLVKKMVKRLSRAASNEDVRLKMEAEDLIERLIRRETEAKDTIIQEKDALIQQKDAALNEKDAEILALKRQFDELRKSIK